MRIPRLYTPQSLNLEQTFFLEAQAAHHVATVLRIKKGRELVLFNGELFNGKRGEFNATVSDIHRKKVSVHCHEFIECDTRSPVHFSLGVSLIKNDRMDWLIQKATELGVDAITPLYSDNTDIKLPEDRLAKKQAHWQQVMINACEQSRRTSLVKIHSPQTFADYTVASKAEHKVILHPGLSNSEAKPSSPQSIDLLIGPEGGFSDAEVEQATQAQFKAMALGPRILRAETAPLAALSIMQYQFGDFRMA